MANARNARSASAADFTATNPYLEDGEIRVESDTRKTKTGPGYWTDLDYDEGATSGGSSTVERIDVPLAHDTPNFLQTGVTVYTPAVGDVLLAAWFSIPTTGFGTSGDGTSLHLGHVGAPTDLDVNFNGGWDLNDPDIAVGSLSKPANSSIGILLSGAAQAIPFPFFNDTAPIVAMYDDGSGGIPVDHSAGAGVLTLVILKAPA